MVQILGIGKNNVIYLGNNSNPRRSAYYVDGGVIHCKDTETGEISLLSVNEFDKRLTVLKQILEKGKTVENKGFLTYGQVQSLVSFIQAAEVLKDVARFQQELVKNDRK
jgi:hypothetical protein